MSVRRYQPTHMRRSSLVRSGTAMTSRRWLFEDAVSLHVFRCSLVTLAVITASTTDAQTAATTSSYSVTPSCGSNLTGDGNITSPYYPAQYPNNAYCAWSLSASPGKILQLYCRSFDLENNYDYLRVTSQAPNKTSTYFYSLSGNSTNCSWILGPTASVTFTSDSSVQHQGFVLGFRSIMPPTVNRTAFTACGGKLNGSGIITSPNYPARYPSNAYCVWSITAQGGNSLRFSVNIYDVEYAYDVITIYNSPQINETAIVFGNGSSMWWWAGGLQTGPTAVVVFSSDASLEQTGFSINFWSEWNYGTPPPTFIPLGNVTSGYTMSTSNYAGCGGYLNGEGNITTPGYPNNFPPYSSCSWTITAANGSAILLEFLDFALDKQYSYLSIWDNLFYYNYYLSGSDSNITSLRLSSQITLFFRTYNYGSSRGFSLKFRSVVAPNTTNASSTYFSNRFTSCGSNLTNQGNFTSPNYPSPYPNNAYCMWNISASPGKVLQLFCLSLDLENNYDNIYITSQIYNKTTVTYDWLSGNSSNCSWNLGTTATVGFYSDATVRRQGFVIGYRSVAPPTIVNWTAFTQCGGNATGSGLISSPNYPGAYPSNSRCIWRLRAFDGQVLRLSFNTYDVEGSYDTVLIYNSSNISQGGAMNYTSYWQQNMYYTQFNSEVIVVFMSDESVERQGFQIYFTSEYPSGYSTVSTTAPYGACSYNLTGDGNITSPNYPALYPNNAYCTWSLSASPGKVLQLYCRSVDLEIGFDYLSITSQVPNKTSTYFYRLTGISSNCSWILGETAFVTFTSDSSVVRQAFALGYRSMVPPTVNRTSFTECGGNATGSGSISSPNYPGAYPSNSRCIWRLRAFDGQVLRLYFNAHDVEGSYDTVLIYNSANISQGGAMNYTSYWQQNMYYTQFNSEVIVVFTSDESVERQGFQIYFTSEYPSGNSTVSTSTPYGACSYNLTGDGNITSPNYPALYPNNALCTWSLSASPGKVLQLYCRSVDLENNYDYLSITSQVPNKTSTYSYRLTGISSNCSWILGKTAFVTFTSDSSVMRPGFALGYRSIVPPTVNRTAFTECGGNVTSSGTISSPNYPGTYPSNSRCIWRLRAFDGQVLRLYFNAHDVEGSYDTVLIYNSSNILQGGAMNYTSYWQQNMYYRQFNSEVYVVFTSDESIERQGFQIYFFSEYPSGYSTVSTSAPYGACGGYLYGEGNITTPGYPNNFSAYSSCSWTITAANGSDILLEFLDFSLDKTSSYLTISSNGPYYVYYYLSGAESNMTSLRLPSQTSLYFGSYSYGKSRGFSLRFKSVAAPNATNSSSVYTYNYFTSCGSNLTNQGNFTSPNYPAPYPNNAYCVWNIFASPGKVLQLFCRSFDLEGDYDSVYVNSQVYNKTTYNYYRLSGNSSNCSMNLGATASVSFYSDATVKRQGFVFGFRSVTPPSTFNRTSFTQCGGNLNGSGTLTSPNYPGEYPSNSRCTWRLRAWDGLVLRLYFNSYSIEDVYDSVMIYNSANISQGSAINYTSYWQQNMYWTQFNSEVVVEFTSDESVERRGFEIYFYSEKPSWSYTTTNSMTTTAPFGCGGYLYGEGNITSPGYPNNFPAYSSCSWTITAANGSAILLEFLDFALDKHSSYLYIWDNGPYYRSYSLSGTDSNVTSLRLSSQINLYFNSYSYGTSRGFSLRFKSVAASNTSNSSSTYNYNYFTSCGSNLTNQGNFTSPNYPAQYPNNAICVWNISASPGKVLQLFCHSFDLEGDYDSVYVNSQVYNKTTYNYYWLTGNSSNCSMNLGTSATVSFYSDATVRRQGFIFGFRSVTPPSNFNRTFFTQCGGNLTGSGYVSTPNYPGVYPSNSRCTWRLTASNGQVLKLYFYSYDVEEKYDSLIIYNSRNISQGAAINYTSYWQQNMYGTQFNSEVIVVFTSDENIERQGFQIYFTSEYPTWGYSTTTPSYSIATTAPSVGCGGDIYREGNVSSPNYPRQYPNSSFCSWSVATSYGSSLVIEFVDLDIVKGSDFITIFTNDSSASFGGSELPRPIRGGSTAYIQFSSASFSNSSLPRRGFKIRIYTANSTTNNTEQINEYFTSCGGNFTGKGNLTSPGYPALYPNKAFCTYSLSAQTANDNIVLKFTTFDLEQSYDYLFILNSNNFFFPLWFTGSSLPSTLVLSNQATIWFSSDTTVRGRGFFATFLSVPANTTNSSGAGYTTAISITNKTSAPTTKPLTTSATTKSATLTTKLTTIITTKQPSSTVPISLSCGGILYNGAEFASPKFPAGYPNNTICNWTLIASPGKVVLLSFQFFALESGADYLRVYNGTQISWKTPFTSYTGFSVPSQLLLTENASVVFTSDESLSFQGFKANFTSVPRRAGDNATSSPTSTPFVCGGSLGLSGAIASPNFPYAYPNNVSCTWTFSVPRGGAYKFQFLNFSTEQFWDKVVIRTGAVETTRVSGSQIPTAVVMISSGSISFTSDESVQMSGFRIQYSRLTSVTTPRTTVKPTTSSLGVCGQAVADMRTNNARIIGGYVAPTYSIPWQVLITKASTNFSGVLINNQWVLTAASNLKSTLATACNLLFGKQRSNAQDDGQLKVAAKRIVRYPGYNETTGDGDIALIQLATSVTFTTKIRRICLPTATVQAGEVCYTTGWGAPTGSANSGLLKVARVPIIERQNCFNYIQPYSKNQICGGYIGGGEDVCQGDTGGPLVYFSNGRYELQGITSSHTSCGKPFSPSAFTAVAPYISWITSVTN